MQDQHTRELISLERRHTYTTTKTPDAYANSHLACADVPQVDTDVLQVGTDVLQVDADVPQVDAGVPQVDAGVLQVGTDVPQVGADVPQVDADRWTDQWMLSSDN